MTRLVETVDAPGSLDQITKDLSEAVVQPQGSAPAQGTQKPDTKPQKPAGIPDKFWDAEKGEVKVDLVLSSYTSLESQYGRMANDLGHQRKLTDRLLDLKRESDLSRSTPAKPKLTPDELLSKPDEALDRFLDARDAARESEVQQRVVTLEQQLAAKALIDKHPDWQIVAQEPEFVQWVQASPFRARLGAQVAQQQDWSAADELLSEYKERKQATKPAAAPAPAQEDAAQLEAARKASLEGGNNSGGASKPGKVYRRVDLLELKMRRPEVYYDDGFQAEILRAYSEGRVK